MSNFQFSDELYYVKLRATDSQGNHNWLGWLGTNVNGAGYAGYHNAEATQPPQPGVLTVQWVTDTSTGRNYLRAVNYPGGSRYLGGSGDQGFYLFWTPGDANGDPITADVNGNSYYLQQLPISGSTQVTINRNGGSTPVSTYNNYKYLGYWQASSERIVTFEFLPVGNFSPKYENWMQDRNAIIGNRALPDIAIPGSHDAGSTSISRPLGYVMSQAQNLEIYDQLMAGSRYLDLRAKKYNGDGVWYIHHGLDWTTLKLVDVASQLAHFPGGPSMRSLIAHGWGTSAARTPMRSALRTRSTPLTNSPSRNTRLGVKYLHEELRPWHPTPSRPPHPNSTKNPSPPRRAGLCSGLLKAA
jgi:hypothetical protein